MVYIRNKKKVKKVTFEKGDKLSAGIVSVFSFKELARLVDRKGAGDVRGFVIDDDGIKVFYNGSILRPSN